MLENNFWSNLSGSNHVDMPAHCQLAYATSSYAPHHNHTTTNNPHHHHHHQGTQHSHQHQHQQHHHHYHQQQHQQQQHQNYLLNASPFSMCHDLASPIAAVEPLNRYNNNNNNNYNAYSASGHSWAADYQNKYSTSGNYLIADAVADFNGNHETSGNTPAGCLYSLASDDSHTFNICPSSSSTSSNSNSSSNSSTSSTGSTNTKVATGNSRKRPNRTNDGSSEQQQQHQHQQQRKKVSDVGDSKTAAKSGNCVGRRERTTANKAVSASMSKRNTSEQNESLIATMAAASEKSDKKSPKSTSSSPATRTPTNHSNHGVSVDGCTPFSTFFDPTTLQYQHQHQQRRFSPGQRQVANQRERDRTHSVNSAFLLLRSLIPTEPLDRKLSKIETLRLAGSYIHHLSSILNTPDEFSHEPCLFMQRLANKNITSTNVCTFCLGDKRMPPPSRLSSSIETNLSPPSSSSTSPMTATMTTSSPLTARQQLSNTSSNSSSSSNKISCSSPLSPPSSSSSSQVSSSTSAAPTASSSKIKKMKKSHL